jgi:hypothetical protein
MPFIKIQKVSKSLPFNILVVKKQGITGFKALEIPTLRKCDKAQLLKVAVQTLLTIPASSSNQLGAFLLHHVMVNVLFCV